MIDVEKGDILTAKVGGCRYEVVRVITRDDDVARLAVRSLENGDKFKGLFTVEDIRNGTLRKEAK